jgi:N-succinyldiaminopimelate aminotransferase
MKDNKQQTFKMVPHTGVVFVIREAITHGFYRGNPDWCNLGQGQPEVGMLDGGVQRVSSISISEDDHEYASTVGLNSLRQKIADCYNGLYREGMDSKYKAENVAVCPGGRAALTRLGASIGNINLGHFVPDYTAYEEMLSVFKNFNPIPILLDPEKGYNFSIEDLRREITGRGLGGLLVSNPCNPTGKAISGKSLSEWVGLARELNCSMIMDEFYSSYHYSSVSGETLSSARYVEDVNKDPIVIVDGITKNWRYPGWRIAWIVGPADVIRSISSAGSFLDGGANRPFQSEVCNFLSVENIRKETAALQRAFRKKRRVLLDGLQALGIKFDREPDGAFYAWGNVEDLPDGLNDGMSFFKSALRKKVIVVPGEFFDVNPGKRRGQSRFKSYIRFSFGPEIEYIEDAVKRLSQMVKEYGSEE